MESPNKDTVDCGAQAFVFIWYMSFVKVLQSQGKIKDAGLLHGACYGVHYSETFTETPLYVHTETPL